MLVIPCELRMQWMTLAGTIREHYSLYYFTPPSLNIGLDAITLSGLVGALGATQPAAKLLVSDDQRI